MIDASFVGLVAYLIALLGVRQINKKDNTFVPLYFFVGIIFGIGGFYLSIPHENIFAGRFSLGGAMLNFVLLAFSFVYLFKNKILEFWENL